MIYGSKGSMEPAKQRRGDPLTVTNDGVGKLTGDEVLELVPDFHLEELPARLFGSERLGSYDTPFEDADRFLVALEYYELGQCIADGTEPEVNAYIGRKDLAVCNRLPLMSQRAMSIALMAPPILLPRKLELYRQM